MEGADGANIDATAQTITNVNDNAAATNVNDNYNNYESTAQEASMDTQIGTQETNPLAGGLETKYDAEFGPNFSDQLEIDIPVDGAFDAINTHGTGGIYDT